MANQLPDLRESENRLRSRVEDILAEAKRQGASAAEVSVSEDVGLSVTVRMRDLESVEFNHDRGFGITVYYGHRKGSASTSDSSTEAIRETVRAAANIARYTQEDPCAGLADPQRMAGDLPELDLYHPWTIDPEAAQVLALECEAAGLAHDPRVRNSDGASVSTQRSCRVYGNSHGFVGSYVGSRHSLSCVLIAADDAGMQRDYWYTTSRNPEALEEARAVGVEAARRTVARLSPRRVRTGSFPVAFSAQAAGGLAGHLLGAISGGALYRRASFLPDSLGTQVAADHLTLAEAPHLPGAMGSAGFDGEGVATSAKAFIDRGVVASYVLSSYSGRKLDLPTTGNAGGVFNLTVSGRTLPIGALLRELSTGLLVTDLMGQGVNSVTGDYSRGASGFWVEGGEVAYPVDEITIASNLKDMFRGVVCLGDDVDLRGNIRSPTVLIDRMTLAGD
ncbi:MAG TPA: metalloprotease PmbA [Pseudomonadales bacterium]